MKSASVQTALLIILVIAPGLIHCEYSWSALDVQCIADSAVALDQSNSVSDIHCTMKASTMLQTGLSVAQFSKVRQVCRIFRYQSVCRQLVSGGNTECVTFARFPISPQSISPKLSNLWLADDVSRLENLVCQIDEDTNRFYPVGALWTSDGLKFDGVSSHMILNKSSIGFTGGLTWLLRIKRKPQVQVFFEFNECNTLGVNQFTTQMWEHDAPRKAFVRTHRATGNLLPMYFTAANRLSSSADDWVNVGFTTDPAGISIDFFLNNSFLPRSDLFATQNADDLPANEMCVIFGKRVGDSRLLNGVLRAIAFANVTMSEAEIQQFYSVVT